MKIAVQTAIILILFCVIFPLSEKDQPPLKVAIHVFPDNLHPVYVTDETSQAIVNKVYESLFRFNHRGRIVTELVQEYFVDTAKLEIILRLQSGHRFADGKPLTSTDVVSTIRQLLDPETDYPYRSNLSFIEKVSHLGPDRIHIKMKTPFAPWKNYLTFKILESSRALIENSRGSKWTPPRGSGPYRFVEIAAPNRIVLEKNPHYHHPVPVSTITYQVVTDPKMSPLKLLNSEIHISEIQPQDVKVYRQTPSWQAAFQLVEYRKFGFTYLVFNLQRPNISREIRRIIFNTIQCGDFMDHFLAGSGERIHSPFLLLNPEISPTPFKVSPPEKPVKLSILGNSESRWRKQFILFLKEELTGLNIQLQPRFYEYQTFLKRLKEGHFDLALSGFLLDIDWDMSDIFSSPSPFNYARMKNREMDHLLDLGLQELSESQRANLYRKAHLIWLKELPLIPVYNLYYYIGITTNIRIPALHYKLVGSTGDFLYNIQKWHWADSK